MTTVYLSESRLQVVGGSGGTRGSVTACATREEIGAWMYNGGVADKVRFCSVVGGIFADKRFDSDGVRLVVNTPQIMTREIKAPSRDERATLEFIANELGDIERSQDPVYSYMLLERDKSARIDRLLACVADREYINGLFGVFAECGVTISAVEPALFSAIRALGGLKDGASVVLVMEKTGFTSLLMANGQYVYSTYNRLASAHGTPELGSELARSVSAIAQFVKAQRLQSDVSRVYFAGFDTADRDNAADAVARMGGGIETALLPESPVIASRRVKLSDCLFAAGGLIAGEVTENLLRAAQRTGAPKGGLGFVAKSIIALAIIAALLIAGTAGAYMLKASRQAELDAVNVYLNSEKTLGDTERYNALSEENLAIRARTGAAKNAQELFDSYPLPDSSVNNSLQECANGLVSTEIIEYTASTGELRLDIRAAEVDSIHDFITRLDGSELFSVANYSGYEYLESEGVWSVFACVVLSAPETEAAQ